MRVKGHNILAIVVAAIVFYAIEFVIFALLMTPEQYMAFTGMREGDGDPSRMPYGIITPILTAIGLSMAIKWRGAVGVMGGIVTALWMAVLFAFSTSLYGFVYGPYEASYLPVNLAHFLVAYGAAGAVLGAWK